MTERYRQIIAELAEMRADPVQVAEDLKQALFAAYLKRASAEVKTWPQWKRDLLGTGRVEA